MYQFKAAFTTSNVAAIEEELKSKLKLLGSYVLMAGDHLGVAVTKLKSKMD